MIPTGPLPNGTRVWIHIALPTPKDLSPRGTIVEHKPQNGGYLVRHRDGRTYGWSYAEVSTVPTPAAITAGLFFRSALFRHTRSAFIGIFIGIVIAHPILTVLHLSPPPRHLFGVPAIAAFVCAVVLHILYTTTRTRALAAMGRLGRKD